MAKTDGIDLLGPIEGRFGEVLTPAALDFVALLERELGATRRTLLRRRVERQAAFDAGERLDFLPETRAIRERVWTVAPAPKDLERRWVELTGPAERKMVINALNSGADVFMADFEDANTPGWRNMVQGQVNLVDAVARTIEHRNPDGRVYRLNERIATLLVRPRGWHLVERHCRVDGAPMSCSTTAADCSSAAADRTSTCRSSRATRKRGSGTTRSCWPRTGSACRAARSARPS
jgi:malate synthase